MGSFRWWRHLGVGFSLLYAGTVGSAGCYDAGDGTAPPLANFYFPVGLKVSHGGTVLYAVNSNFDLQFNGGTLQSYDLSLIRQHALFSIANPADPRIPLLNPAQATGCPGAPPVYKPGTSERLPLGAACAPPVDSRVYVRDSVVIGAFATELLLSSPPSQLQSDFVVSRDGQTTASRTKLHADDPASPPGASTRDRLFIPVRGNSTLTWASVVRDTDARGPSAADTKDSYPPFRISCGQEGSNRCDAVHQIGADANEEGNSRRITMPGEPFGAAFSADGESIVLTHQSSASMTLFSTGLSRSRVDDPRDRPFPAIQFVAEKVPAGGVGVASVPHDPDAFLGMASSPRDAFLQTSRQVASVTLVRKYSDEEGGVGPSLPRPFLLVESGFPITTSSSGVDSRGIAIDPTPRLACKARVAPVGPGQTMAERDREMKACARKPARAFIANRSPAALLIGDVGSVEGADGAFNPDRLTVHTTVPLPVGPSKVYLAPIVDRSGAYSLRVFVVCFDAATVYVFDPDAGTVENQIRVGPGPFAMAFDPFSFDDVARHLPVPLDPRDGALGLRRYRFAYVASFTQSFVQVLDLDSSVPEPVSFERVVYTLGQPTNPKGS
jgi:hypothetical protein